MRRVFKYELAVQEEFYAPQGARFLHFDHQGETPCVWLEVDGDEEELKLFQFSIVGTGWDVPDGAEYLATSLVGAFVWHLYTYQTFALEMGKVK